ncbi:hypothetical protein ELQ90_11375 [Labedella phragmitis]|uniref:DUF559 domain-containing protein n=1 Tax=Labedella phragmitis TaxID=2498849 RepID=A0A444PRU3_9MICO|nr:hypothetical protein [Labedella phragmitis]RWZ49942.1 hypothetical protein ELQ90_11375 [Labedella phragmitis]
MPSLFESPHIPFELSSARRTSGRARPTDPRLDLQRVRRGVYIPSNDWAGMGHDERYRAFIHATLACSPTTPTLSHYSAAALRRLPIVGGWPETVHTVVSERGGGRSSGVYTRHRTSHSPEVDVIDGVRCTSLERTIVDVARIGSRASALSMADHAVRLGLTTRDRLLEEDHRLGTGRGSHQSRTLLAIVAPEAANGGESLVRLLLHDAGFVAPTLQLRVDDCDGLVGFVDFAWLDAAIVLEFDGMRKYAAPEYTDGAPEEVVWREKRREDRLRALGLRVVRATWGDLTGPAPRLFDLVSRAGVPRRRLGGNEGAR